MRYLNLLILNLAFFKMAVAATPLVRTSEVSEVEYRAFLLSDASYQAISLELIKNRPQKNLSLSLRERYETAERTFISDDLQKAHLSFLEVTEMSYQDDWNEPQRAIITHAYLRAAQTAPFPDIQINLLTNACRFNHEAMIDRQLYPPPLVEEYLKICRSLNFVTLLVPQQFKSYSYALINGRLINLSQSTLVVPPGEFRITLISDLRAPITRILSAGALASWSPQSDLLVKGDCKNPQFHSTVPVKTSALFSGDCIAEKNVGEINNTLTLLERSLLSTNASLKTQRNLENSFYHNKWFWGAMGVLTAAIVIDHQRHKDRRSAPEPTVKEGF